ncbi:MAG: HD-GYP domain-containing protein [Chloroflexota bacterium]|nr:HD-GYP domain-containing protein [Chloroflexota bacterium]
MVALFRPMPKRSIVTASDELAAREQRRLQVALLLLAMPIVIFSLLRWFVPDIDPAYVIPREHFLAVSLACIGSAIMAVLLGIAAVRTREPRTFFLAATFITIATVFSVHGLMTPGQTFSMHGFHNSLSVSAQLALFMGAVFILLAALPLPARIRSFVQDQFGPLMTGLILLSIGYVVLCLSVPAVLDWVPTGNEPAGVKTAFGLERASVGKLFRYITMTIGMAFASMAAARFYRSFATTRSFPTAAMAICALLLAQCLFIQNLGEVWQLSWWMYHALLLVAVVLPMYSFARMYRNGRSLIEIVDSLLLNETLAKVEYSFPDAIDTFVSTVEARDPYLKGHMRRVCELSVAIADELKVPDTLMRAASYAALLHDIGKLGLPAAVLHKPGRLTDDEFELLKEHPSRGFTLVANVESLRIAAPAIRWHHERLDGSGYPDALSGDEVPLEARIIAVADVWDALTSDRVYRKALSEDEAREILLAESGTKLDPECVAALMRITERNRAEASAPPVMEPSLAATG